MLSCIISVIEHKKRHRMWWELTSVTINCTSCWHSVAPRADIRLHFARTFGCTSRGHSAAPRADIRLHFARTFGCSSRATSLFITHLLLNRSTATWNIFVLLSPSNRFFLWTTEKTLFKSEEVLWYYFHVSPPNLMWEHIARSLSSWPVKLLIKANAVWSTLDERDLTLEHYHNISIFYQGPLTHAASSTLWRVLITI